MNKYQDGEEEGESITLTDSSNMSVVELSVSGNDEQEERSGKNLYNVYDIDNMSENTTVDEQDYITMSLDNTSGNNTVYVNYFTEVNQKLKESTQYYGVLEIKEISGTGTFYVTAQNSTDAQTNAWLEYKFSSLSNSKKIKFNFTTIADFTSCLCSLRTFLKLDAGQSGSITARISVFEDEPNLDTFEYEAYGAMPSPLYPSEVETVNTQASVVVSNKNILNFEEKSTSWKGSTITVAGNKIKFVGSETGDSGLSYISSRQKVDLRKGTTLTYSSKYVRGELTAGNTYYNLNGVNKDGIVTKLIDMNRQGVSDYKTDKQATYTLQEDIKEIYISGSSYLVEGLTELIYKFQLEIGDTATDIIEHAEQTKVVDIQQEMLEGDYFVKEEDGWKEVHGWKYDTFKANSYGLNNDGTKRIKITAWGFQNKADCKVLCRYFKSKYARWDDNNQIDNAIYGWNEYGAIGINFFKEQFSSIEEFSSWATEVNLGFYYQLATPTKLVCTERQSKQLDDLLNTSTYKNVTHIYSTDKVSPIIKVVYRKDTPTLLNNICKLIIENGGI